MKHLFSILFILPILLLPVPAWVNAGAFEDGLAASRAGERKKAFEAFKSAADEGDERAYGRLATLYLFGAGTRRDPLSAYVWFGMAIDSGDKEARRYQDAAQSSMTTRQQEEAIRLLEMKRTQTGRPKKIAP